MSHLPERKEKNCLNCDTQVIGRFCHTCGQENIEPKETIWHLVSHFLNDVTHFDGKFFSSLKHLVFKPGFLSKEYVAGKRASNLNPIRMYLFTSAIFFLIFFSLYKIDEKNIKTTSVFLGKTTREINKMDSAQLSEFSKKINKGKPLGRAEVLARMDSAMSFRMIPGNINSKKEYDSLLKSGAKKHNWIERQLVYKNLEIKEKYGSDSKIVLAALGNKFVHSLPQMLFVLLPLFALILKLIYIRRKQFYYVDHVIFTIHLYIFIFLVMLVIFGVNKIISLSHWAWLRYISSILVISIFFYFYKALRNFYKQRRAKTIFKYIVLIFLFFFTTLTLFVLFGLFSLFSL